MQYLSRYTFASVYSGIPTNLLTTICMSPCIKADSHEELITQLIQHSIIKSSALSEAFKEVNRQLFTTVLCPFQNKPYPISQTQNMSDIFTHATILQQVANFIENKSIGDSVDNQKLEILDIGTGNGYLVYVLQKYFRNLGIKKFKITGIDLNEQLILYANGLRPKLLKQQEQNHQSIVFQNYDISSIIQFQKQYDIILGGFHFEQSISQKMQKKIKGIGIWQINCNEEKQLFIFSKTKQQYFMNTMFAPKINSQKYSQDNKNIPLQTRKKQKKLNKRNKQQIKIEFKKIIQKYRINNKIPSLNQMIKIQQIKCLLEQLAKLK